MKSSTAMRAKKRKTRSSKKQRARGSRPVAPPTVTITKQGGRDNDPGPKTQGW